MQTTYNPIQNALNAAHAELFNDAAYTCYRTWVLLALRTSKTGLYRLRYLILCRLQEQMGSSPLPVFLCPERPTSTAPVVLPEVTLESTPALQEPVEQLLEEISEQLSDVSTETVLPDAEEPQPPPLTPANLKSHSVNQLRRMARKRNLSFDRPISKVRKAVLIAALTDTAA